MAEGFYSLWGSRSSRLRINLRSSGGVARSVQVLATDTAVGFYRVAKFAIEALSDASARDIAEARVRTMIEFEIYGRGQLKAIALHGLFADGRCFQTMLSALDPDLFSVATPNLRGYGRSANIDGPNDMTMIAADALAIANSLGWGRFAVIGHSMGGKAALRLAIDAPARVSRIVGIAPVWASALPLSLEINVPYENRPYPTCKFART